MRVLELGSKFRYLPLKKSKKQSIVRQLSSCITEKYNGFSNNCYRIRKKKTRKNFKRIDIIYKPTKNPEKKNLFAITALMFPKHIVIRTVSAIQKN